MQSKKGYKDTEVLPGWEEEEESDLPQRRLTHRQRAAAPPGGQEVLSTHARLREAVRIFSAWRQKKAVISFLRINHDEIWLIFALIFW